MSEKTLESQMADELNATLRRSIQKDQIIRQTEDQLRQIKHEARLTTDRAVVLVQALATLEGKPINVNEAEKHVGERKIAMKKEAGDE